MSHTLAELTLCNAKINLLPYKSEVEEDWTPAVTEGDCDSYATAKMQRLVESYGWPERSLRLATCFVDGRKDSYHCVLLADFDSKTYVLDNRYAYPMEYDLLPYEWHKFWNHEMNAWEWANDADKGFG